jgi:DNA-binding IclR family transcriptional regulator
MADVVANASVLKACKVLRVFTPTVGVLSVRQVAARAQIPRSTAHELCRTLVAEGMLENSGSGYQLGPLLLELAGQIIERTGLLRAAEGILDRLVRAPEQDAHLGQLTQGGWVVYLDRNSSIRHVPMSDRVGQRAPAHLTGCGKAALTWLPFDKVVTNVKQCCVESAVPVPNLEELEAELSLGRQNGYVTSRSWQKDRMSVAAAILDSSGHPLGGVSLAGPASMFTSAVLAAARSTVTDAAGRISARMANGLPPWSVTMR